jgi:hypothetical protein
LGEDLVELDGRQRRVAIGQKGTKDSFRQRSGLGDKIRPLLAVSAQGLPEGIYPRHLGRFGINPINLFASAVVGVYRLTLRAQMALQIDAQVASFSFPPTEINMELGFQIRFDPPSHSLRPVL